MKNLLFAAIAAVFSSQVCSQDVVLLLGSQYNETDQTFGGKYLGYYNSASTPYIIDEAGRITGRHLTFHENGQLETVGNYRNGIKHGLWMSYDESGNALSQAYYTDGRKDGAWKVWDANGTLRCEMYYKFGKRVKTWKFFDESGSLIDDKTYE